MKFAAYLWLFCLVLALPAQSAGMPGIIARNYEAAVARYAAHPEDDEAAWHLGRACFDRGEYTRDDDERERLAKEGMAACQKLIDRRPASAPAHYYMGMDIAELARTKKLGALPLLHQMEKEWSAALALDKTIDYAGPDRNLGLLYRDAPGWPISLGSRTKAQEHLLHAVELSPTSPENRLNLIESYLQWNDPFAAMKELEKLRPLLPAARKEFAGEYWAESWKDWDARSAKLQLRLENDPGAPASHNRK